MSEPGPAFADPVGRRFWLLGLAQTAHSIEEMRMGLYEFFWTATGRLHSWAPVLPQLRMAPVTFAILNMAAIALLLGLAPFVMAGKRWARAFAAVAGAFETANGIGHLSALLVFGAYVPGAISAPFLALAGIGLLLALRRRAPAPTSPAAGREGLR